MEEAELSEDIITGEIFLLLLNNSLIINLNDSENLYS